MKKTTIKIILTALLAMCVSSTLWSQVGIGTSAPNGMLDISNTAHGIVYPRVALTSATSESPIVNPNAASLIEGTVVYNTSLTTNGANDVSPGIYVWNGTRWIAQQIKEDHQQFVQTGGCQRTTIREFVGGNPDPTNVDAVSGLDGQVFTPKYSGTYRVEVKTNFSAGAIEDFTTTEYISLATSEGAFFFTMSGPGGIDIDPTSAVFDYQEGWIYTHSYASYNEIETPELDHNTVPHYASVIYYLYLLGGNNYNFTLSNCINTGDAYFVDGGDANEGQGHIGHDTPCTIEFTYVGN